MTRDHTVAIFDRLGLAESARICQLWRQHRERPGARRRLRWRGANRQFLANPFGLHDMHGNVAEWNLDAAQPYADWPARPGDGMRGYLVGMAERRWATNPPARRAILEGLDLPNNPPPPPIIGQCQSGLVKPT